MNKCTGCGAILQNEDEQKIGFIKDLEKNLCERCFRIRNYNDYKRVVKDNDSIIELFKKIEKEALIVLVVDIMNIPESFSFFEKINNDILLVLSKSDLLPSEMYDEKLENICESFNLTFIDKVLISSNKNYNLDLLMEKIRTFNKNGKVYFLGYSNSGKSTLINKIIYNYTSLDDEITTSLLPSTTLDFIEIKLDNDLTIFDTPGLLEDGNLIDAVDPKLLPRVMPKKKINPRVYQIKGKQIINIENIVSFAVSEVNIVIYISNDLKVTREYNRDIKGNSLYVSNEDIVIPGLGFIKVKGQTNVIIKTKYNLKIFKRKSIM